MFSVGDLVTRTGFSISSRDMYVGWTYEVAGHTYAGTTSEIIQLVGIDGNFHPARFKLACNRPGTSSPWMLDSSYMDDDTLDDEDKRIITEAIQHDQEQRAV